MIHDDHPFATPPADRDPVRQFRGRMAAPVTVVTAGPPEARTGLTVSSLMVSEGEPAQVLLLLGTATDLLERILESGRFVVHILEQDMREAADVFAGLRPNPGGPFSGVDVEDGDWGPVLTGAATRLYCRYVDQTATSHHALVQGEVDHADVGDLIRPLVYFRGDYRRLE